ncbi:MAG: Endoribonuclease YbeY [Candidatus Ordinivivax streblomastigis]|uniref:Endoribonuclease YbeY n=1 Tax=Candidatus Ordinivivax streblomastigis TaxID=2540710 RepID=A0A5M8NZF7_9BACT|nr:MAG: Endoribonuclease YbeY [Candidatus Ordinivivax streblomastigis]
MWLLKIHRMAILYNAVDIQFPTIKRRETSRWIKEVIAQHQKRVGEISYIFCSDEEILKINQQYLNHDYYTDIITFDYSDGKVISGDLFISLETVKSNSEQLKTDYFEELHRVIIHGILHLCGFKDKLPKDAKQMRKLENEALKQYEI